jgi:hypothetical protein
VPREAKGNPYLKASFGDAPAAEKTKTSSASGTGG